jgi:hypothetical protein
MIRVKIKTKDNKNYYLLPLTVHEHEEVHKNIKDKKTTTLIIEETFVYTIDYSQIIMYGSTANVTEEQAKMFVTKAPFDEERMAKRKAFVAKLETKPIQTVESEFINYTCYGVTHSLEHKTPLSSFKCALEQINYPKYALIYWEEINGTV